MRINGHASREVRFSNVGKGNFLPNETRVQKSDLKFQSLQQRTLQAQDERFNKIKERLWHKLEKQKAETAQQNLIQLIVVAIINENHGN